MAYSSVGSFGTVAVPPCPGDMPRDANGDCPVPPGGVGPECPGSLAPNDDGTCPFPPDTPPCDEGSGEVLKWGFVRDATGNPTQKVEVQCGCPPGWVSNPADPSQPCVPRVCGDFDLDNSEPCVDDTGTYPEKWSYRAGSRKPSCLTSPYDLLPLHPAGTSFVDVAKRQRQRENQRYYADLHCKGWSLGTKLMVGAGVVFGGLLVGSLISP